LISPTELDARPIQHRLDRALEIAASTLSTFAAIFSGTPTDRAISIARSGRFLRGDAAQEGHIAAARRETAYADRAASHDGPSRRNRVRDRVALRVGIRTSGQLADAEIERRQVGQSCRPCSVVTVPLRCPE